MKTALLTAFALTLSLNAQAGNCLRIAETVTTTTGSEVSSLEEKIGFFFNDRRDDKATPTGNAVWKLMVHEEALQGAKLEAGESRLVRTYQGESLRGGVIRRSEKFKLFQDYAYAAGAGQVVYSPYVIEIEVASEGSGDAGADLKHEIVFDRACPVQ